MPVALRINCPACRDYVTLDPVRAPGGAAPDYGFPTNHGPRRFGQRRCPQCDAQVFVVLQAEGTPRLIASYPSETLDFDASDLPEPVREAMEEAVRCHAHECFVAAAMMVRKAFEEVCRDRDAKGGNLKDRIAALRSKVVLPEAMFAALDNLRLLGNDAAHVESRDYNQVGKEEVEVAIGITKEILKATYQLDTLMGRLGRHKRADP